VSRAPGVFASLVRSRVRDPVARAALEQAASTLGELARSHLAAVRAVCAHPSARLLLTGPRGTLHLCPHCLRLVVHADELPR
jgi:hypothetical protein